MRIGIDCRMMGPEQGGIGRYAEQLVKHLLEIDRENQYILFLRKEQINNFQSFEFLRTGFSIFNYIQYSWTSPGIRGKNRPR